MNLIPFFIVEPELGPRETRVINLPALRDGVPAGSYGILEFYCPSPACDCRRVLLNIVEEKRPDHFLASISFAFDRDGDMTGPLLDPINPQSRYAGKLLQLVEEMVLSDLRYAARLERHYAIVKRAASDPEHPAYPRLQQILAEEETSFPLSRPANRARRAQRNAPCPCGSGRKYKHCCMRKNEG